MIFTFKTQLSLVQLLLILFTLFQISNPVNAANSQYEQSIPSSQDISTPKPTLKLSLGIVLDNYFYSGNMTADKIFVQDLIDGLNEIFTNSSLYIQLIVSEVKFILSSQEQSSFYNVTDIYDVSQYYTKLTEFVSVNETWSGFDLVMGLSWFTFKEINPNAPGAWYGNYATTSTMMFGRGYFFAPIWMARAFSMFNSYFQDGSTECPDGQYVMMTYTLLSGLPEYPSSYSQCTVQAIKNVILPRYNDTIRPWIYSPQLHSFELGSTGNLLTWQITDDYPGYYELYQDDVLIDSSLWSNFSDINFIYDTSELETTNFTMNAVDYFGNNKTRWIIVDCVDTIVPQVTNEYDIVIDVSNKKDSFDIEIFDLDLSYIQILINQTEYILTPNGNSALITLNFEYFINALYIYTITAVDGTGNSASHTFNFDVKITGNEGVGMVTTETITITEISTVLSENSSGNNPIPGFLLYQVPLIISALGILYRRK